MKSEYSDWEERIERLSSYVASTGKKYKSHYATIRNWARKDKENPQYQPRKNQFNSFPQRKMSNHESNALERMLLESKNSVSVNDDPKLKAEAEALKKELQEKYTN